MKPKTAEQINDEDLISQLSKEGERLRAVIDALMFENAKLQAALKEGIEAAALAGKGYGRIKLYAWAQEAKKLI